VLVELVRAMSLEGFEVNVIPSKCPMPRFSVTIEARRSEPLGGLVKVLAMKYPPSKAIYSKEQRSVTLRIFGRMVRICEDGFITFCAESLEEAKSVLSAIRSIIEEARLEAPNTGIPSDEEVEGWNKLNTLELYKYLPRTNCRKCGEGTCIAFAAKVLSGERELSECSPIRNGDYNTLIEEFRSRYGDRILRRLGWK